MMSLPLPNLDDRRWADLIEEGRALVPLYAPKWTDHNIHDPGIMLMELLAWVTEMDIYWLNRIPEHRRHIFLALVGIRPEPPRPARAVLSFTLKDHVPPLPLPCTAQFEGRDPFDQRVLFRTLEDATLIPGGLQAVQLWDGQQFSDLTERWRRRERLPLLGTNPQPGATLYLGLSRPIPGDVPASLFFSFAGAHATEAERKRIEEELAFQAEPCRPPGSLVTCREDRLLTEPVQAPRTLPHHSVRLVWEYWTKGGTWQRLDPAAGQVLDETRGLTLNGRVVIHLQEWPFCLPTGLQADLHKEGKVSENLRQAFLHQGVPLSKEATITVKVKARTWLLADPVYRQEYTVNLEKDQLRVYRLTMGEKQLGQVQTEYYYIRCRLLSGTYDASPELRSLVLNGVLAEQAVPTQVATWPIAVGATVPDKPPAPGQMTALQLQFNDQDEILGLGFEAGDGPQFRLLAYIPPVKVPGSLSIEAESLGKGTGWPEQRLELADAAVQESSFYLYTLEDGSWRAWEQRDSFDASGRNDAHFCHDPTLGHITFGDGERGRVVSGGASIIARYRATRAEAGNLSVGAISELADTPHNRALLPNLDQIKAQLATITNPLPASGGMPAETLEEATGRALSTREKPCRAITRDDCKALAKITPGVQLARVEAWANLHPGFPCFKAPGIITVIVLPHLPAGRPVPSRGLRRAVAAFLSSRRVIGTRVEVVGPTYTKVAVRAQVRACMGVDKGRLRQQLLDALNQFLDPLAGGPDGEGWPFGRDVYRSEVLQVLDETPGVDHVLWLELMGVKGEPSCGNVCLGPLDLVAAGQHQIEVM